MNKTNGMVSALWLRIAAPRLSTAALPPWKPRVVGLHGSISYKLSRHYQVDKANGMDSALRPRPTGNSPPAPAPTPSASPPSTARSLPHECSIHVRETLDRFLFPIVAISLRSDAAMRS